MLNYIYKTPPLAHQAKILDESADKEYVSLFLRPGLGKSFIIINNFGYLYEKQECDTLVVVAPNGVHRMWVDDEIPKHLPDRIRQNLKSLVWNSQKAKSKKAKSNREALLKHDGPCVIVVAYEAMITEAFKAFMKHVFAKKIVFMALDESHRIKGRGSKTRLTITAMGNHTKYRRVLSGTPTEKPPDIYSQIRFLSADYWKDCGFKTAAEFDARFCVMVKQRFGNRPAFNQVVGYQNLDQLQKYVAKTGYAMTLEDAGIQLPPLTYSKRYYEMFPEQRRIYDNLANQFRHEFEDGVIVDCEAAITRLLRLQQVVCGYLGTGPGEPIRRIGETKNPRMELLCEVLEDLPDQSLVFCRFTQDIDQAMEALGKKAIRYDGSVDEDGRAHAKSAFNAGDYKYMVLSSAGAEGLTLIGASSTIFYSNNYSMIKREQMEGRNYRLGQNKPVHIIDLVCEGTVDNDIIEALRNKFDLASQLTGSKLREML